MIDSDTHRRFLDYRERHAYFGRHVPALDYEMFASLDREYVPLLLKDDARDDEEQARFVALSKILLRD